MFFFTCTYIRYACPAAPCPRTRAILACASACLPVVHARVNQCEQLLLFLVKGQYSFLSICPWQSRRRSSPAAQGSRHQWLLIINTCLGMQWRAPANKKHDERQEELRGEASHGSKRPSLIARDDLPVAASSICNL
jgi:hypothetical protein